MIMYTLRWWENMRVMSVLKALTLVSAVAMATVPAASAKMMKRPAELMPLP